jgi:predicted lipoprotein with Yx(FWY)xxD motif
VLADASGRTLYEHTTDGSDNSTCTGSCSAQWPPLSIPGQPTAGGGVTGTLSVFKRTDGTTQVAIDGHPLYLYAGDHGPGDTAGQGVQGQWYAVSPDGQPVASPAAQAAAQATVQVATNPAYGPILTDSSGSTLYIFTQDVPGLSRCTGACAKVWPPLLVGTGTTPTAGPGVTGKIGTMHRSDGGTQVTINGQPLYTYSGDSAPGQTNGQGIGNTWFVVEPSGAEHG